MKNFFIMLAFGIVFCHLPLSAQWSKCAPVPGDHTVFTGTLQYLAVNGSRLFATRSSIVDSIFYTDDNGSTWNVSKLPGVVLGGSTFYPAVAGVWANNGTVFASGGPDGKKSVLWRSSNNGASWDTTSTGFISTESNRTPVVFIASGNTFYAGSTGGGIYLSTNSGISWAPARTGIPTVSFSGFTSYVNILCFAIIGNDVFAGLGGDISAHGFGVRHTTLGATTWDSLGTGLPASSLVYSMLSVGTTLYARVVSFTAGRGLYKSTDLGATWTNTTNALPDRNNLPIGSQGLFSAGHSIFSDTFLGDYVSTDDGGSWAAMDNTGLPSTYSINGYALVGTTMFITVTDASAFPATTAVWKRDVSQVTGVREIESSLPASISLAQNYPNPFNPSTTIRFEIPRAAFATLKVYDVLGREVATLVNEPLRAGTYDAPFDASSLASGVYRYQLRAGAVRESKTMLLVR